MTVHHLLEAELEILDAVSFYKARAGDLAVNFYAEFKRAREEIAAFPEFLGRCGRRVSPQTSGAISLRGHLPDRR